MDIPNYLNRIEYLGPVEPTSQTLFSLHRAHLLAVPFENLDIHLGRPIRLDEASFFEKIVHQRRGGFCYEINGLFRALLVALDFHVTMLSAILPERLNGCGLPFDHPILLVTLDQEWVLDVGFGDVSRVPLRLDTDAIQEGIGAAYRLAKNRHMWSLYKRSLTREWDIDYTFDLRQCRLTDFELACEYYQSSPQSFFTQNRLCSRATPEGSVTMTVKHLIITVDGLRRELSLDHEADFGRFLLDYFGIKMIGGTERIQTEYIPKN